jgi:hypothetical protein
MVKNNNNLSKRIKFTVACVVIYCAVVGIVYGCIKIPSAISNLKDNSDIKNSKVVLYEGPKSLADCTSEEIIYGSETEQDTSLKHSTNTHVSVNGEDCYVYETMVNNTHTWMTDYYPDLERTPITYFDFDGKVRISVKVDDIDIEAVNVRPLKYNIKPDIDVKNHTVSFVVDTPDAYTVEFNNSVHRAVHIFANEIEENAPDPDDENVLYIGPGEWNIETIVPLEGQTIYIAGGAVVHGTISCNTVNNIKVYGRGIIDGSSEKGWKGRNAKVPIIINNCNNFSVSGIIELNSNCWAVQAYDCIGGTIDNLKVITARPNGDGISLQSCKSVTVKNSFLRTWDDTLVVKNYDANSSTLRFSNIQVWTDLAQSMEIGYETNKGNKEKSVIDDVLFEDITVLHNFHKPVISIHNADNTTVKNITYKNITVEDASVGQGDGTQYLIDLEVLQNDGWSTTSDRGQVTDVTIDGLNVLYGNDILPSLIQGYDKDHKVSNVTIKNMTVKGQKIKSADDGIFTVDALTTDNINIE